MFTKQVPLPNSQGTWKGPGPAGMGAPPLPCPAHQLCCRQSEMARASGEVSGGVEVPASLLCHAGANRCLKSTSSDASLLTGPEKSFGPSMERVEASTDQHAHRWDQGAEHTTSRAPPRAAAEEPAQARPTALQWLAPAERSTSTRASQASVLGRREWAVRE